MRGVIDIQSATEELSICGDAANAHSAKIYSVISLLPANELSLGGTYPCAVNTRACQGARKIPQLPNNPFGSAHCSVEEYRLGNADVLQNLRVAFAGDMVAIG